MHLKKLNNGNKRLKNIISFPDEWWSYPQTGKMETIVPQKGTRGKRPTLPSVQCSFKHHLTHTHAITENHLLIQEKREIVFVIQQDCPWVQLQFCCVYLSSVPWFLQAHLVSTDFFCFSILYKYIINPFWLKSQVMTG